MRPSREILTHDINELCKEQVRCLTYDMGGYLLEIGYIEAGKGLYKSYYHEGDGSRCFLFLKDSTDNLTRYIVDSIMERDRAIRQQDREMREMGFVRRAMGHLYTLPVGYRRLSIRSSSVTGYLFPLVEISFARESPHVLDSREDYHYDLSRMTRLMLSALPVETRMALPQVTLDCLVKGDGRP